MGFRWLLPALLLVAATAAADEPLRLCALQHDAPRSLQGENAGLDLDFAEGIAGELGTTMRVVWVPNSKRILEIDESDLPLGRLARGHCDLVGSVPGEEALGERAERFQLSAPYYGAAFELVGSDDLPRKLEALGDVTTAVQLQTFAHLMLVRSGVPWRSATSTRRALAFLDEGRAGAALVWGPDLGPLKRVPLNDFSPPQSLRWNAHFALRKGDPRMGKVSRYLEGQLAEGGVQKILTRYGVPARRPFATVSSPAVRRAASEGP